VNEPDLAAAIEGIDLDAGGRASLKESIVSIRIAARRLVGCTCGCGGIC